MKMLRSPMIAVEIPAGEYYIGDPCYFFKNDDWNGVLNTCGVFSDPIGKAPNGEAVLGFGTAYGDGTYLGSDGFEYGVDAGLIGAIRVGGITRDRAEVERLCNKVRFAARTICTNNDGVMSFGRIVIDTKNEPDEEDDD